jgi:selenocysteine-specific elongation factor
MGPQPLTIGTAGHIDHGKTALVRALTGRDTDRLGEEKRRGISIELGFAELDLGGRRLSLIDVPGHERFVRTMIAGASGIDMFMLVIAADDGVMPQTTEHLAVLSALGVESGLIALTKCDRCDSEVRRIAAEDSRALAPGLPLVEVSARTGEGLDELRRALAEVAETTQPARELLDADPVLHVDRAFTIAGHGTVVTGTLWSGRLRRDDRVILLPHGHEARVRSIEIHDRRLEEAGARQRVALNLGGVGLDEVARGDVVTVRGAPPKVTFRLDAELLGRVPEILAEHRAQVHLGTRETPARIVELGEGMAQLRLERPLIARRGDRVVIRRIAPPDTLGGGRIVEPAPRRHGPGKAAHPAPSPPPAPSRPGEPASPGPLALRVLAELRSDGLRPRGPGELAEALDAERRGVEGALKELVTARELVRLKPDVHYPVPHYERIRHAVLTQARRAGSTSIAEVRDMLGVSRKYAQALLEHLDGEKALRREGDRHVLRGGGSPK